MLYNNVKFNLNLIDFHPVLNISLISTEKELEQIKFRHLSKLKNLIPNFYWDLVVTAFYDLEKVVFNFSSYELLSIDKSLHSKKLCFTIPLKQLDYFNFMTEFEQLLYRSSLVLSMTSEERDRFKTKVSFSFVEEITTYDILLYMTSLDDGSLFTNILLNETIKNCVSDLHNKNLYNAKIRKTDLIKLPETAKSKSSFIFDYH